MLNIVYVPEPVKLAVIKPWIKNPNLDPCGLSKYIVYLSPRS